MVRRDPRTCGLARSRWRLADILEQGLGLDLTTPQSLGRLLAQLGISYKRGRDYIHSPDPDYDAKLEAVHSARQAAQDDPDHQVLLYLDEMTLYRQPLARRSQRSNTPIRLLGALDAVTGVVHSRRPDKITLPTLVRFCTDLVTAYPGRTITVVLDN